MLHRALELLAEAIPVNVAVLKNQGVLLNC